jgi:hypothetical protein
VLLPNDTIVLITRKENISKLDQLFARAQKKK